MAADQEQQKHVLAETHALVQQLEAEPERVALLQQCQHAECERKRCDNVITGMRDKHDVEQQQCADLIQRSERCAAQVLSERDKLRSLFDNNIFSQVQYINAAQEEILASSLGNSFCGESMMTGRLAVLADCLQQIAAQHTSDYNCLNT